MSDNKHTITEDAFINIVMTWVMSLFMFMDREGRGSFCGVMVWHYIALSHGMQDGAVQHLDCNGILSL